MYPRTVLVAICTLCGVGAARGGLLWAATDAEPAEPVATEAPAFRPPMTVETLRALLRREGLRPEGEENMLAFFVGRTRIIAMVDPAADRMRFGVPLQRLEKVEDGALLGLLQANYAATADLRFAVNRDVVWLLFMHPLSSLTEGDALSAINQLVHHSERLTQAHDAQVSRPKALDAPESAE